MWDVRSSWWTRTPLAPPRTSSGRSPERPNREAQKKAAEERLAELGIANVTTIIGDGWLGWPPQAPFDRIVVTAAATEPPPALVEQLKVGGRMIIPLGETRDTQSLVQIDKTGEGTVTKSLLPVRFVPLMRGRVTPELVHEIRARLDQAGFGHVQITVSGGLNPERILVFKEAGAPVDSFAVGSYISGATPIDFTGDIKEIDGRPIAKRGRIPGLTDSPRLQPVDLSVFRDG